MRKLLLLTLSMCSLAFAFAGPASAQVDVFKPVCDKADASGATVCEDKNNQNGRNPFWGADGLLGNIIDILSVIGGIAAVIMIILSGLKFITSGDNPQEISSAKNMIIYAAIGLIVIASAQVIVRFFLSQI